jgi:nicotinate dehydrogenase subunit B
MNSPGLPDRSETKPGTLTVVRPAGAAANQFETFIKITADGSVAAFNGHVDLGTGIQTALGQIVAEELDVSFARVVVVLGDTSRVPNQGATIASETIQITAVPLRKAAAQARQFLVARAAERLELPVDELTVEDGLVHGHNRSISYGELISEDIVRLKLADDIEVKSTDTYRIVGQSVPRVDLPAKATGELVYVHDMRVPGMLHGRVVRPPYAGVDAGDFVGTSLLEVDESSVSDIAGLVAVVRIADFVGVVAEREENAIKAATQLKLRWKKVSTLPDLKDVETALRANPSTPRILIDKGDVDTALKQAARPIARTYIWPYQMHASIGPSCALADVGADQVRVWSGTQNPHILRADLALLLQRSEADIDVIRMEAAGCYGRNCADDVSADAVLLSRAVGRPVRVQLTREQEHAWEPKGTGQLMDVNGGLDANGGVGAYDFATRYPSNGAPTLALLLTGAIAPTPVVSEMGDRTAIPPYDYDNLRVVVHDMPPIARASWLRGVSALPNTFAHESYIDELANEAGVDPIEYRLRYLRDKRAIDLVNAVAERAGWKPRPVRQERDEGDVVRGRGFAYALYVHSKFPGFGAAWSAWIADVAVNKTTGDVSVTRVVAGQDSGLMINPDGVRHQIQGNVIQSTSRALMEEVSFSGPAVASREWGAYPIIKFPDIPKIDVLMLPRNDQPPLGVGESASVPSAAAIANAIFDATGVRFRELPFTPERILAGLRGEQSCARRACRDIASTGCPRSLAQSVHWAPWRICNRRRARHRLCWHRRNSVAVAVDCADRAAGCVGVFHRHHRARPAARKPRRLRGLPYVDSRRCKCRRPRNRDTVRHHLQHEHHTRCRDRHRQLVVSGVRARHAGRYPSRRGASLPGIPLHAFCFGQRCGLAGALRFPDGASAGARPEPRACACLSVQLASVTRRLECTVPQLRHLYA